MRRKPASVAPPVPRALSSLLAAATVFSAGPVTVWAAPSLAPPVPSPPRPTPTPNGLKLSLSLAEAVFLGLRDNRTVKSAYIERVAQKYDLFVAKARFLPQALVTAGYSATLRTGETRLRTGETQTATDLSPTAAWLAPTGATFSFSWATTEIRGGNNGSVSDLATASVTQPLLKGAGLAVNLAPVRVAELQEEIDRLALKSTVSNTVTVIVQAYRTLLQAQDQLQITRASLDRSANLLDTNTALIAAGRMAAAEIVQTQADVAAQKLAVLQAEQSRNSAQLALLQLLAMDLRTNIAANDQLAPEHVEVDVPRAIETALSNRMDLLAQRRALQQDRQNLIVAKNNRLWSLSVVGSYQYQRTRSGLPPVQTVLPDNPFGSSTALGSTAVVGLQLSVPIGDFTLKQGEIQAETAVRSAEVQLADLQQAVEAEVRDAAQTVELSWRQLLAARDAERLASRALDVARQKLEAGRSANFEVLTFESSLRVAESQSLAASVAYLNALTVLDQQLGTTLDTWRINLND